MNHFQKLLILLFFLFIASESKAQFVTIPDLNFVNWLNSHGFSGCMSGNLMDTTCITILSEDTVDCAASTISDLNGIQYFDNLTSLFCDSNQLTFLPNLPKGLKWVDCRNNMLTALPSIPDSLKTLICGHNPLTSIPNLPLSLLTLACDNTLITSLPPLPSFMASLIINDNPGLTCLPPVAKIAVQFIWGGTGITCLPNEIMVAILLPDPPIIGFPICDVFNNVNGCTIGNSISGIIYKDTNQNCQFDAGEPTPQFVPVIFYRNGLLAGRAMSNSSGKYYISPDTGVFNYSIDTSYINVSQVCPISGSYISTMLSSASVDTSKDFAVACHPGFDLQSSGIIKYLALIPGSNTKILSLAGEINSWYHLDCTAGISGTVKVIKSGPVTYLGAAPLSAIPIINGDTLFYNVIDFSNSPIIGHTDFLVHVDSNAVIGQQVCFTLIVEPFAGDNDTTNNTITTCFTVSNSFDPNIKEVYPTGLIDSTQNWLTYTIYFQNTGTAPAQHIYILDTLSGTLDISSFQLTAFSHEPQIQIIDAKLRFNFPNINLPDSVSNEPASHGYVQYKVKPKRNLPVGTQINNTAYIYFDFNSPVQTNTTSNVIDVVSGSQDQFSNYNISIYPNPIASRSTLNIFSTENIGNAEVMLVDMMGKIVYKTRVFSTNLKTSIQVPEIQAGVYQLVVSGRDSYSIKKIIVQNKE
jgi:uncharacterized repeat protein (TIGR01451 family)